MICPQCNSDNARGITTCAFCQTKLPGARHSCGFINAITDQFCGGCGEHIIAQKPIFRPQVTETQFISTPNFADTQLIVLLDLQKQSLGDKSKMTGQKQEDIDRLFE